MRNDLITGEQSDTDRRVAVRRGQGGALGNLRILGRIERGRGVPRRSGRHYAYRGYEESYGLAYITAGHGRYRDATHDVPVTAGSLIRMFPGMPHWYGVLEPGQTWNEVFLIFDGPLFQLAAEHGILDPAQPLQQLLPVAYWQHRFDEFRVRRPPTSATGRDAEACDLARILTEISGATDLGDADTRATGWFDRTRELLESDLDQHLPLPEVAAEVDIAYDTWRRRFRDEAGCSPGRYRLLCRVDAARELLIRTSMPTREIAAVLGFSDLRHLVRQFRAVTGRTPHDYRVNQQAPSGSAR